jgi:GT2 family glycosyltransferase
VAFSVGIGIVTYDRKATLSDQAQAFTRQPGMAFVVADDDGSSDGTLPMLRDKQVPVITGVNIGIAWHKNRALFLLSHMLGSAIIILLKDDTEPNRLEWETEWIMGAVIAPSPAFSLMFGVRLLSRA